jgi:hypothetical protein
MDKLDETLRRHRVSVLGPADSKFKIKLIDRLDEKNADLVNHAPVDSINTYLSSG